MPPRHVVLVVMPSAFAAAVLAGCEPTAPANPSFQTDIMPILAANCVRCHGVPSIGGAPAEFRLDSFSDTVVDNRGTVTTEDDFVLQGAAAYAGAIGPRITSELFPMPPRFGLEPYQVDTIVAWVAQMPPVRGEPRPGNQLPVLSIQELGRDATTITLAYQLHDPDGDLVVGSLCDDDGAACAFAAPLQSGNHEVRIDMAALTTPIVLRARLDDGAGVIDQAALQVGNP